MTKVLVNETSLTSIAEAIRGKNGLTDTYKPSEMAAAITAIPSGGGGEGLPEEALTITGNCMYRFAYGGWDWFINEYGNQITTVDIENPNNMFSDSKVEYIPFQLNFKGSAATDLDSIFSYCSNLKEVPKMNNCRPSSLDNLFYYSTKIREIPADINSWFDWTYVNAGSRFDMRGMFSGCHSLRSVPMDFLNHSNSSTRYNYSIYYNGFNSCETLDEIVGLPVVNAPTWTTNAFYNTVNGCNHLKNFTFATSDGQPYVVNWKSQTIDLATNGVGYGGNVLTYTMYNSGITEDKQVTDDATYQALKDDPDWFSTTIAYSRYNHDSAVATINSLPDASAYLATAGGTNTIKFDGPAGSATDGGAINTLTEEEIAVATAKGWTVSIA